MTVLAIILIICGALFLTVSCIGLLRLPDFYSRCHAVGKSETLGSILVLLGLAIYNGWAVSTFKVLLIILFVLVANPAATHAITRAAIQAGLDLWTRQHPEKNDRPSKAGEAQ